MTAPTASPQGAVFLSYAREDTDAARRIAEALRGFGVEVWFDQNELRGGDQWDAKIKKQIRECALFLPLVSQHTEERSEGYFRREWLLAVERTRDMAAGRTFIMPVVVDATAESGAEVPEEFMRYQWTRLTNGEPTPDFVTQVKRTLEVPKKPALKSDLPRPPTLPPQFRKAAQVKAEAVVAAAAKKSAIPGWMWGVAAAVLVAGGAGILLLRPAPPAEVPKAVVETKPAPTAAALRVSDKSIAVLPFTNMSEDKDTGFFADGVHEDLLTNLAVVAELKVISRTSVLQYRGTTKTMRQIGQELGVAYLLEGSVRRAGSKVRVTGQLINTRNDEHVWARSYDRDLTDIFAIQSAIAQEIATALSAALSPEVRKHLDRRPTENPVAYDRFLQGRIIRNDSNPGTLEPVQEAERLFQAAVDLDPGFAAAWGELAVVHALYGFWGFDHTPERIAKGEAAMRQAERLAPNAPDVIRMQGTYAYYAFRDYDTAIASYEKLARLQPNDPTVYSSLALISRRQGRMGESVNHFRRAVELDPANFNNHRNLAISLFRSRRWDEQRAALRQALVLRPDNLDEQFNLVLVDFDQKGSTQAMEKWIAGLDPAVRESPRGIYFRKQLAWYQGNAAEYRRLDRLQPFFAGRQSPGPVATEAASVFAAAGDLAAARERIADLMPRLRDRLSGEPANIQLRLLLGTGESILGNHAEAFRHFRQVEELLPEARDAMDSPWHRFEYAMALARSGDKDQALAELARLLKKTSDRSVHFIRIDPGFASLRGDPRFEALLADPKNNAPLY